MNKVINLVFVDPKTAQGLNQKYRNKDYIPTVLEFYYKGQNGQADFPINCEDNVLGEIILCMQEAKKQGLTVEELISHGLKNLLSEIPPDEISGTGNSGNP